MLQLSVNVTFTVHAIHSSGQWVLKTDRNKDLSVKFLIEVMYIHYVVE